MVACPKCGANNPAGRRSCRVCGESLGETGMDAATLNRMASIGAESEAEEDAAPGWLQLLLAKHGEDVPQAAPRPIAAGPAPQTTLPEARQAPVDDRSVAVQAEPEEAPDWLDDLRARRAAAEPAGPKPIGGEEVGPAAARGEEADDAQVAGWLSRLESLSEPAPGPAWRAPAPEAEATPDWPRGGLDRIAGRAPGHGAPAEAPESPSSVGEEPPAIVSREPSVVIEDAGEVPSWLTRLGEVEASAAPATAGKPVTTARPVTAGEPAVADAAAETLVSQRPAQLDGGRPATPSSGVFGAADVEPGASQVESPAVPETKKTPAIISTIELKEQSALAAVEPETPSAATHEDKEAVPDWLAQLISAETEAPAAKKPSGPAAMTREEERRIEREVSAAEPGQEGAEAAAGEIPSWLADLNVSELGKPGSAEAVPSSREGAVGDRTVEIGAAAASAAVPTVEFVRRPGAPMAESGPAPSAEGAERPAATEDLPEWLSRLKTLEDQTETPPETPGGEAASAVPEGPVEVSDELLADIEAMGGGAEPPSVTEEGPAGGDKVPDWLRELRLETPEETPAEVAAAVVGEPGQGPSLDKADIPEWMMRLRPDAGQRGTREAGSGLPDVLPISHEPGDEETLLALRARLTGGEAPDVQGATLFRKVATETGDATAEEGEEKPRRRVFPILMGTMIFLILLVLVAIVLMVVLSRVTNLVGMPAFERYLDSPASAGLVGSVQAFRSEIAALPEGAAVVVSFDYSPATEAEMGLLADVVLDDLLQRRARIVCVSLTPQGAMMAQRATDTLNRDEEWAQVVNLGYLPGNAAGVRSLTSGAELTTFDGRRRLKDVPGWEDVDLASDVAMTVAISDNNNTVRWWVEQRQAMGWIDQPLLAAVSAASGPAVRPYQDASLIHQGRLQRMIAGVNAAAAYEVFKGEPGRAVRSVAAQSVLHVGTVLAVAAGAIAGFRQL